MIYLGADHRGFKVKEQLRDHLTSRGYQVADLGTNSEEPVDYPVIASSVGHKVLADPYNRGILVCGSGAGVCIAANKIKGIRAAETWNTAVTQSARNDDNINVLCLAADHLDFEQIREIAQTFLDTSFGGDERFKRRLNQIGDMEKSN